MIMNGKTQLIGIIGWPVSHSFSPAMHNAAAADLGINWAYLPLPVHPDLVAEAMAGLPALGLRGANVTVPHKQAIIPHLHGLGEGARAIGAVNTIVVGAGGSAEPLRPTSDSPLTGYNTDWTGFLDDLATADVDVADRDCLVLGAGGSARAVVYALAQRGGRVRVLARRIEQAQSLVADLAPFVADATLRGQCARRPGCDLGRELRAPDRQHHPARHDAQRHHHALAGRNRFPARQFCV